MRITRRPVHTALLLALAALAVGCAENEQMPTDVDANAHARGGGPPQAGATEYTFERPVFDIDAAPNGSVIVGETVLGGVASGSSTIWEIASPGNAEGKRKIAEFTTPGGVTPINGLATVGQRNYYAAQGGLDLAANAAVLRITPDGPQMVADVEAYEKANDPDLFAIEDWKDPQCAPASGEFTPGPQSNPYHLALKDGGTVLLADAAGNTLLRVKADGSIELVALFTPPTADGGASTDPATWVEFPFDGGTPDDPSDDPTEGNCYVQPVPDAVAIGDDGDIYVGELTGVGPIGVSRVWRIEEGATGATCPSEDCEMVAGGFTSIIDMTFGPDGYLYVVEYDEAGWLTSVGVGTPEGGTVNRCDVETGSCEVASVGGEKLEDLTFPAAMTFDRHGNAWLLENNLASPTVRKLD